MLEQSAALGFVSLGQTLVVLAGGIDLSVGGIVTGSAVLLAGLVNGHSNLMIPALIAVLLCGAAVGALNGVIAVRTGVHPLIVTLGMASILNGLVLLYTLQPAGKVPAWFQDFAFGRFLGWPIAGIVMLAAFSAVGFLLLKLPIGRSIYAVGGNYDAARLYGIRADKP